ncbi:YraN family protein [Desulfovibrio sp. OttesenSCG-928-G11]|nr:YraN family protein [Desulfovibrio sp. OttesenSCG-928-G11]
MGGEAAHLRTGSAGEDAAAAYVLALGWRVTDRNWRPLGRQRGLELDIVARDGKTLVFVEVKTRRLGPAPRESAPAIPVHAAFTERKKQRLLRAASLYLSAGDLWHLPCRFDFIGVELAADGRPRVEHQRHVIENGHIVGDSHASWQPW